MRGSGTTTRLAFLGLRLGVGLAIAGSGLVMGPARASADSVPNPACPASNAPTTLTLAGGSPQTAVLDAAFASSLQVALGNANGCPLATPLAGVPVTFSAPASGASVRFAGSGSNTLTVGSDASGMAEAAMFSANGIAGSYVIVAGSPYGSVSFAMTNTAAGVPAAIRVVGRASQSATVATRYKHSLEVRLLDASGAPLQDASVTFTLGAGGGSSSPSGAGAGASFSGGASQATVTTTAAGIATSPRFEAGTTAGRFTATAALTDGTTPRSSTRAVSFPLRNLAGVASTVTAGAAASESAATGAAFPIRLAVTVTDAHANPVSGALVTFSAPGQGPSGTFTRSHRRRSRIVRVTTNAAGVAVAPAYRANGQQGGYVVKASVKHAGAAAFALVNLSPGQQT
jgi:adhesin/invasin